MAKEIDRSKQIDMTGSKKAISLGLYDIDSVIKYYFDNVIQPTVTGHDGKTPVPIIYASPEKWKSISKGGFLRDSKGKIQLPAIAYQRTSMENSMVGTKVDVNNPLVQSYQKSWTKRNRYDNFAALNGRVPVREYTNVVVPDYVKLAYDCIIWADYITQLNLIIEDINYAANQYWGNERFKFLSKISSFATSLASDNGEDRASKATFTIEMNGYIIPNNIQKSLSNFDPRTFSPAQIVMGQETLGSLDDIPNTGDISI
jgi:hypothetical protein